MGEVVSTVGSWMQMLALGWLVLELTDSGGALGVTMALQTLPILLVGVWAGVVADRVDNRRLLAVTALAGTAEAIGVGVMVASGHITIHWIYFFGLVLGVVTAFDRPAMQAMNYELAGPDDLPSVIGIASTINSGGRLLGPAARRNPRRDRRPGAGVLPERRHLRGRRRRGRAHPACGDVQAHRQHREGAVAGWARMSGTTRGCGWRCS